MSVAADTDTSTRDHVAAAINAILPANTVVAAGVAGGLTLTAEKEGLSFSTTIGASDGGASMPAVAIASTRSISTSLEDAGGAVSLFSSQEENLTVAPDGGDAVYKANVGVRAMANVSMGPIFRGPQRVRRGPCRDRRRCYPGPVLYVGIRHAYPPPPVNGALGP